MMKMPKISRQSNDLRDRLPGSSIIQKADENAVPARLYEAEAVGEGQTGL